MTLASLVVAVIAALTASACGDRPAPAAAPSPPLKTFVGTKYPFSVSYDPRFFVVDARTDRTDTIFVARPRWPGQPDHFNANKIVWVNCVFISVSNSPPWRGAPELRTAQDVRDLEAAQQRWDAAHRVVINGLVGTMSEDVGVEGSSDSATAPAKSIVWVLKRGDVYFHVQVDCPTKYWPIWGPRMLAVVNSLQAVK